MRTCDECGGEMEVVDQPTPMTVYACPRCSEEGPSERQIQAAMNWSKEPDMLYVEKDNLGRGGLR